MEFPELGRRCKECAQVEFLPVKCPKCHNKYCPSHSMTHAPCYHETTERYTATPSTTSSTGKKCSFCSVALPDGKYSVCEHCQGEFCLSHRHQFDHSCSAIQQSHSNTNVSGSSIKSADQIHAILKQNNLPIPGTSTATTGGKPKNASRKKPANPKVRLMKLKMKSQGPSNTLPQTQRFYFSYVTDMDPEAETGLYVDQSWSVGRVLDFILQHAKLTNTNNQLPPDSPDRWILVWDDGNKPVLLGQPGLETTSQSMQQVFGSNADCVPHLLLTKLSQM